MLLFVGLGWALFLAVARGFLTPAMKQRFALLSNRRRESVVELHAVEDADRVSSSTVLYGSPGAALVERETQQEKSAPDAIPEVDAVFERTAGQALFEKAASFDLKPYFGQRRQEVEDALAAAVAESTSNEKAAVLTESMRYSLLAPAKRVRPVVCLAACEMLGGKASTCMPTAVALEMIHSMSLIHDDLPAMDNDSMRRGLPTNHVKFSEPVAILAGDALLSEAFKHVATRASVTSPPLDAAQALQVVALLGDSVGYEGLAGGQTMDIVCEGKEDVTLADLRWIHLKKTAALLKVAVTAGAVVAGAGSEDIRRLEVYAENIGLAFQIADDILDVTQSTEELGKTAGKDLDMAKTTYPKLMGLERSRQEAQRLVDEAIEALVPYGDAAIPLVALARYIIDRKN
uniref:Uncharacterized protein n=1 Tax=Chromera velia CCMP2878 TaxID=1169474 RepID=A0A0G4IDY2_9ALVE|eukprot:Cvel_13571.t1-p1 / transcript=Cvel_13571.t1 / gene=Cvel_13571 / organism=Chromera_velia_CCMP2878 / gene_product=Geranylgeranyl pyrophosphate synthase,, putative / transcript_product=Geranylgeranyl pyrophosphate synthase,, putative / location=Cvel_scaffold932:44854-49141(-) / protein_length=402 / sequence_SO=supercontig / SO=protein_coding / is_pseudo=false